MTHQLVEPLQNPPWILFELSLHQLHRFGWFCLKHTVAVIVVIHPLLRCCGLLFFLSLFCFQVVEGVLCCEAQLTSVSKHDFRLVTLKSKPVAFHHLVHADDSCLPLWDPENVLQLNSSCLCLQFDCSFSFGCHC